MNQQPEPKILLINGTTTAERMAALFSRLHCRPCTQQEYAFFQVIEKAMAARRAAGVTSTDSAD